MGHWQSFSLTFPYFPTDFPCPRCLSHCGPILFCPRFSTALRSAPWREICCLFMVCSTSFSAQYSCHLWIAAQSLRMLSGKVNPKASSVHQFGLIASDSHVLYSKQRGRYSFARTGYFKTVQSMLKNPSLFFLWYHYDILWYLMIRYD